MKTVKPYYSIRYDRSKKDSNHLSLIEAIKGIILILSLWMTILLYAIIL